MIGTKKEILEYLKTLPDDITLEVKEIRETRSQQQNRLYHRWLTDICFCFREKGIFISHDDLHEGLRDKLITGKYKKNPVTGKRLIERKSTAQLNKKEFSQYIKDIEMYLWQTFEIVHPLPTDFFYEPKKDPNPPE